MFIFRTFKKVAELEKLLQEIETEANERNLKIIDFKVAQRVSDSNANVMEAGAIIALATQVE